MGWRRQLRLVPLVGICAMLNVAVADSQFPAPPDRRCIDHPPPAQEIETSSHPSTVENRHTRVVAVTFEGADHLSESVKSEVTRYLEARLYGNDSSWLRDSKETIKDALGNLGYFPATVSTDVSVVSSDPEKRVAVIFRVTEGRPYRLTELQFSGTHVFSPSELRKYVPLRDGGMFNRTALRQGVEALRRLYGNHGYLNITILPDIRPDNRNQLISLTLHLEEDQQFRVGSVEVLGLNQPLSGETLKTKLVPGQVLDTALIDRVFDENQSILPADASPRHNLQITQDAKSATVAIRFDFRRCR